MASEGGGESSGKSGGGGGGFISGLMGGIPSLTSQQDLGPTVVQTRQGISGGGFSVVYNTAPLAGGGSLLPVLAVAGAGLAALFLVRGAK